MPKFPIRLPILARKRRRDRIIGTIEREVDLAGEGLTNAADQRALDSIRRDLAKLRKKFARIELAETRRKAKA